MASESAPYADEVEESGLRLQTFISPVLRPDPISGDPRVGSPMLYKDKRVCWVDQLFDGGVIVPAGVLLGDEPPLIWLLTGPPGTGKTTFALELCHHLAVHPQDWPANPSIGEVFRPPANVPDRRDPNEVREFGQAWESEGKRHEDATPEDFIKWRLEKYGACNDKENRVRSLYIALETPAQRVIENMARFGWDVAGIQTLKPEIKNLPIENLPIHMWLLGSNQIRQICPSQPHEILSKIGDCWTDTWGKDGSGRHAYPGVVVIDSLNTLPTPPAKDRLRYVNDICRGMNTKTWITIVICEGGAAEHEPWEFLADIITRFGQKADKGYMLRTFSIVKAKNQSHAWGEHRLKIYAHPRGRETGPGLGPVATAYVEHGGLHVFPSISRHLSAAWGQREDAGKPQPLSVPLPLTNMDRLLGSPGPKDSQPAGPRPALPLGRCAAFVGERGLMKSHLAYLWLLKGLNDNPSERGLLISLRDDERAALTTLQSISREEELTIRADTLWQEGRLMILDFWPGYVPPEEFMHNVLVRLDFRPLLCVVNGIDHISARLPLCAALDVFVPALVQILSSQNVTSVFSATEEDKGLLRPLGLLPMADLVLRFYPASGEVVEKAHLPPGVEQVALVAAERVSAGGIGDRRGLLYRDPASSALRFEMFEPKGQQASSA